MSDVLCLPPLRYSSFNRKVTIITTKCKCGSEGEVKSVMREDDGEFARMAAALGHPARVAIVRFLRQEGVCICGEIVDVLPLAQSTVSQHLKALKEAGWIASQSDGPRSCYTLAPGALERFGTLLEAL